MRIQLHGRFTIEADGQALEGRLPGRRARLLVAYMAAHPHATLERSALIELLWQPEDPGPGAAGTFAALLSKTRAILTPGQICGRGELRLVLPADTLIDSERADAALHDAQAAAAGGDWRRAWTQALSAVFVTQRQFLPEFDNPWVQQRRTEATQLHQDATACYGQACLHLGAAELPSAERCGRRLIAADPLAERGYQLLIQALAQRGDRAAALGVYGRLRRILREELGINPSPISNDLHRGLGCLGRPDLHPASPALPQPTGTNCFSFEGGSSFTGFGGCKTGSLGCAACPFAAFNTSDLRSASTAGRLRWLGPDHARLPRRLKDPGFAGATAVMPAQGDSVRRCDR
ncbi:MAG: hypothetical protein QOI75_6830 [Pseudonocardiales bacterium]|nr:hypothetical protein [Pseudonocardiales bacterium]